MVTISSQAGPAFRVMRNPGTHQVEINTATSATRPKSELHGPRGAKRRIDFPARWLARRKNRCVTRIMIQTNGPPKKATPIMKTKAVASKKWERKNAISRPTPEAITAATGIPRLLNFPSVAGAYPPRASEKSKRAVEYRLHMA